MIQIHRFLWWQDGDPSKEVKEYKMVVHLLGAESSPSYAGFALHKTVENNQQDYDPRVAKMVKDNVYVDDCLPSVPTVKEGKTVIPQLCKMLSKCCKC
ncbi:hypothetical protein HOLleu_00504 [Holothuria leucospilota]|uniref:Uncharacterized protein n=1 Tax=Holothuria leucospilota TaxID=206669 RepID=A0A9Q1CP76_HOLLE|nr:hypothetical protein HOLleu_00504 [Holothuria leucospilota]